LNVAWKEKFIVLLMVKTLQFIAAILVSIIFYNKCLKSEDRSQKWFRANV